MQILEKVRLGSTVLQQAIEKKEKRSVPVEYRLV
jgi:hypothetical protein